jgi:DNA processing protein
LDEEKLKYQIAISLLPGIGSVNAKKLIAYAGSLEGVFKLKSHQISKIPGIGSVIAKQIAAANPLDKAGEEIEFIKKNDIKTSFFLDDDYPARLKPLPDAPFLIFMKGNVDLDAKKVVSIVGTRNATDYGKETCVNLITELAERGHEPLVVSGLAYGIDITAHKAAIKNNLPTVAVLGHGLHTIYPSVHEKEAKQIVENGALLSDFCINSIFEKRNFVKRNRIIAGLADATIVVESASKGGSLITADIANSYNRDVFAFPGRITDTYSKGCNTLIKSNKAALIQSVRDLEYIMGWDPLKKNRPVQQQLLRELTEVEKLVMDIIKENKTINIDFLCAKAGIPVSKLSPLLLDLEFSGFIKSLPGKVYAPC